MGKDSSILVKLLKILGKHSFLIGMILFSIAYLIPRLFYWIYLPLPGVDSDSLTYWRVVYEMYEGGVPLFYVRTPLYPLFLGLITSLFDTAMPVVVIQMLFTYFTHAVLLKTIFKHYKHLFWPFLFVVMSLVFMDFSMRYDTNNLAESFYISGFIWYFIFSIEGFNQLNKSKYWLITSSIAGLIILLRPSALFLLPLQFLVSIYLWRRVNRKLFFAPLVPSFIIILSLSTYNYFSLDRFSISPWGDLNMVSCSLGYIEPKEENSETMNYAIEWANNQLTEEEHLAIENSWDIDTLHDVFKKAYHLNSYFSLKLLEHDPDIEIGKILKEIGKVSNEAIADNKLYYLKFIYMTTYKHFEYWGNQNYSFYSGILELYNEWLSPDFYPNRTLDRGIYSDGPIDTSIMKFALKDYYGGVSDFEENNQRMKSNILFRLYDWFNYKIVISVFKSYLWIFLFFIVLIYVLIQFIKREANDDQLAFILFLGALYLGGLVLASLVEVPLKRYVVPMEFTVYFIVILGIQYWLKAKKNPSEEGLLHVVFVLANNTEAPYFNWFAERAEKEPNVKITFICMFEEKPKMIEHVAAFGWNCEYIHYDEVNRKTDMISAFIKIYFLLRRLGPDVVHTHLFDDSLPALMAARLTSIPLRVITKGDTGFHYNYAPKWIPFDILNNANATHIVSISDQNKSLIEKVEEPSSDKLIRIHHGIPLDELTDQNEAAKSELISRFDLEGFKLIGNVSRLIKWKGQQLIIDVAERLLKERQDVKFILAGTGPDEEELRTSIQEKGLENHVYLAGWVDRSLMPSFYGLMDIYCHTATKEPFGFVIAEALANGTPVLSTDTGVAKDVIINGQNGYLYAEGDEEALYNCLKELLSKDSETISQNAKKVAKEQLDFEIMFNNYFDLYRKDLKY